MKTESLYLEDSYATEFTATVQQVVDDVYVVLDRTLFYPAGGGQPHDTGTLYRDGEAFNVTFVKKSGESISHEIEAPGLKEGDQVKGVIDWDRRYMLMRMHTAAHIVSYVFETDTGASITGNQLGLEKSRIDYNLEEFDKETIQSCFEKANRIVQEDVSQKIYTISREKAQEMPDLFKLANKLPPEVEELRVVEIGNYDRQADGGTHVSRTGEVGTIRLVKTENKGKSNRRVHFTIE